MAAWRSSDGFPRRAAVISLERFTAFENPITIPTINRIKKTRNGRLEIDAAMIHTPGPCGNGPDQREDKKNADADHH